MKKKLLFLSLLTLGLAGCGIQPLNSSQKSDDKSVTIYSSTPSSIKSETSKVVSSGDTSTKGSSGKLSGNSSINSSENLPSSQIDYGNFKIETENGNVSNDGTVFTINSAGTYNLSGTITEGIVKIEAGEEDAVILNLNNVCITSKVNSPILVLTADEVDIKSATGFVNYINDCRENKVEDNDELGNGAIYAKCDLTISGNGSLNVLANYNNGIHTTKDLKIKNTSVNVNSYNNSLKGNDSVTIKSGTLNLISTGGNGIITEDSDVSSKGNQRGTITFEGGSTTIYSCKDAIDASYDVVITEEDKTPEINIFTSNYSSYSGEVVSVSDTNKHLKTTSMPSSNERYSIYYYCDGQYGWADCTYDKSQGESGGFGPGGKRTYYYYSFELPTNTVAIQIFNFSLESANSTENYLLKSEMVNVNANYDTLVFSKTSSKLSLESWTTYQTQQTNPGGPGGMGPGGQGSQGNTNKASYSAKGIKAENEIIISGGKINIKAYDDGIHANYGTELGNGEIGKGDVIINGGDLTIYASDDGIHADRYLTINGGTINITNSYEGLEANVLTINGGDTLIYSTDDGLNAAKKANLAIQIIVSGGRVDVTVASGDTDGIDSNGTFTQTGGLVITRGSGSNMSTGLDTDGTATVSGGTFIAFGRTESSVKTSGNVKTQTLNATFSSGTYVFSCGDYSFTTTNKMSYYNAYIYSEVGNTFTYTKK